MISESLGIPLGSTVLFKLWVSRNSVVDKASKLSVEGPLTRTDCPWCCIYILRARTSRGYSVDMWIR